MTLEIPMTDVVIPAGTTTSVTKVIEGVEASALVVVLSTTVASGGNTVKVTLNGLTISGYRYPILVSAVIAAIAQTPLRIGPLFTPVANLTAADVVPARLEIVTLVVGVVAYGVDYMLGL